MAFKAQNLMRQLLRIVLQLPIAILHALLHAAGRQPTHAPLDAGGGKQRGRQQFQAACAGKRQAFVQGESGGKAGLQQRFAPQVGQYGFGRLGQRGADTDRAAVVTLQLFGEIHAAGGRCGIKQLLDNAAEREKHAAADLRAQAGVPLGRQLGKLRLRFLVG